MKEELVTEPQAAAPTPAPFAVEVEPSSRNTSDQPSIGLVLCKDREDTVAEYALRGTTQPMAVSQYGLTKALPENLKDKLPSVEELEAELA